MPTKPTPIPMDRLAAPAQRALQGAGLRTLEQVARLTEKEVSALHGLGPSTIKLLKQELKAHGLSFRRA